jgi:ATP adenylyltransferase
MQESWELPGAPNAFQHLWTPHRLVYIKDGQQPGEHECPFCLAPAMQDDEALIVHRGTHAYVILNLFPYNSGHLLICPYRHISTYDLASVEEVAEIGLLTQQAMAVLGAVGRSHGYNIGMNQGEVAGAGIAGHLHQHVVPRWRNDSNFFPIIAETKAIPRLLGEVRDELAEAWLKF